MFIGRWQQKINNLYFRIDSGQFRISADNATSESQFPAKQVAPVRIIQGRKGP